jgi:hypothetical protein
MNVSLFTPGDADSVLERFYRCNDGLIRRVDLVFEPNRDDSRATIVCSVKDDAADAQWVNVIFRVRRLREFTMSEGNVTYRVLSDGLTLGWFEGLIFLDFGPYTSEPSGVDDYRRSGCYFAGHSATWEVVPYTESAG